MKDALSDEILFGTMQKGGGVHVDLEDDKLVFDYSPKKRAEAREPVAETV
jgi:hypothetical protein